MHFAPPTAGLDLPCAVDIGSQGFRYFLPGGGGGGGKAGKVTSMWVRILVEYGHYTPQNKKKDIGRYCQCRF